MRKPKPDPAQMPLRFDHIRAVRMIRKLRGGSQSQLIECDDGRFYAVKFLNNFQHVRILANEWLASEVFRHFGIETPDTAIVEITPEFLEANPESFMIRGSERVQVQCGPAFGSLFPVENPDKDAVYDFIPDTILATVANLSDFSGALALDKWLAQADGRQAVFYRRNGRFWATMIDNGYAFQGSAWDVTEKLSPNYGIYPRPVVYPTIHCADSWIDKIRAFPMDLLYRRLRDMPEEWCGEYKGGYAKAEQLLEALGKRRAIVGDDLDVLKSHRLRWSMAA